MTSPSPSIRVGSRRIGSDAPCFVIAEAGVNHDGDLQAAFDLIDAAKDASVDAVKFQTFRSEALVSPEAPKARYQKRDDPDASMLEMVRRLELSDAETRRVAERCRAVGLVFLSTPFDAASVDLLDELGVPAFKIGSGDLTNHLLLDRVASKNKPVLLSTGTSTSEEIAGTLAFLRGKTTAPVALLHCVSSYPTEPSDCNLRAIDAMRDAFGVPVGWSDHTLGTSVAIAAVARGASIVEKHFTLDRGRPGPDHASSLEPAELASLVRTIRDVEAALGDGVKRRMPSEQDVAALARRSLFSARRLTKGSVVQVGDLVALRPGTGIPPNRLDRVVGRVLTRDVESGSMLSDEDFAD